MPEIPKAQSHYGLWWVKWSPRLLLLITLLHFGLLLYGSTRQPYIGYADRAVTAILARNVVEGRGYVVDFIDRYFYPEAQLPNYEAHWPLLQPSFVALSFKIFGVNEVAARLPNMLFIVALTLLCYFFTLRLSGDHRAAFFAGLIMLWSGRYDIELRNEVGASFFMLAFLTCALYYARRGDWRWALGAALFTGLAALQRFEMLALVLGYPLYLLILPLFSRQWARYREMKTYLLPLACVLIGLAIYSPLLYYNQQSFGDLMAGNTNRNATTQIYKYGLERYSPFEPALYALYYENPPPSLGEYYQELGAGEFLRRNGLALRQALMETFLLLLGPFMVWMLPLGLLMRARVYRENAALMLLIGGLLFYFIIFMPLVTHFEERYIWSLTPIILALAFSIAFELIDRLRARWRLKGARSFALHALIIQPLVMTSVLWGVAITFFFVSGRMFPEHRATYEMVQWVAENSSADDVVMSTEPWPMAWYADASTIMTPGGALEDVLWVMRHFGATMLISRDEPYRPELTAALEGDCIGNLEEVAQLRDGEFVVYRFNADEVFIKQNCP